MGKMCSAGPSRLLLFLLSVTWNVAMMAGASTALLNNEVVLENGHHAQ